MFKVNDRDASLGRRSGVFIVNFEHISHLKHIYIPSQTNVASSSLPKKCRWSEFFWSVFSCIRTVYENLPRKPPYSFRMRENTDQKNAKYRQVSRSVQCFSVFHSTFQ